MQQWRAGTIRSSLVHLLSKRGERSWKVSGSVRPVGDWEAEHLWAVQHLRGRTVDTVMLRLACLECSHLFRFWKAPNDLLRGDPRPSLAIYSLQCSRKEGFLGIANLGRRVVSVGQRLSLRACFTECRA